MEQFTLHDGIHDNLVRESSFVIASQVRPCHAQLIDPQIKREDRQLVTVKEDRCLARLRA
jgi:hypothetical protein